MADIDEPMEVDSQTTEVKAGKAKAGKDVSGKKRFEVKKVNQQGPQRLLYSSCLLLQQEIQELGQVTVGIVGPDRYFIPRT
jgi:hypothetical protein